MHSQLIPQEEEMHSFVLKFVIFLKKSVFDREVMQDIVNWLWIEANLQTLNSSRRLQNGKDRVSRLFIICISVVENTS